MFESHENIANALTKLCHPFVEVVIHNFDKDEIHSIHNPFSNREAGEDSGLGKNFDKENPSLYMRPYFKTNYDGRKVKSISVPITENNRKIGMFCINFDLNVFSELQDTMNLFFQTKDVMLPVDELFKDDWQEKINRYIASYLKQENKVLTQLSRQEKIDLVKMLHQNNLFNIKHAAQYVANILKISRASVYLYLKEAS